MSFAVVALLLASDGGVALVDKLRLSVVQLVDVAPNGEVRASGSGFVASEDGMVVTNHHVYEALAHGEVRFFDGGAVPIEGVLLDDDEQDLAVLKIPGRGYVPLTLDTAEPRVGDYAALLAAPLGLSWTFVEGTVAAFRRDGMPKELLERAGSDTREADKLPVVQFSLATAGGASGGAVVNENGAVIAVVRANMGRGGSVITFGIPAKAVVERLAASKVAEVKDAGPPRWRNLGISAVFFLGLSMWWVYRSRARRY